MSGEFLSRWSRRKLEVKRAEETAPAEAPEAGASGAPGAEELSPGELSPEELARLAELLRDGLWDVAQQELAAQGHPPARVHGFIADLAALPAVLSVPQTTARTEHSPPSPTASNDADDAESPREES